MIVVCKLPVHQRRRTGSRFTGVCEIAQRADPSYGWTRVPRDAQPHMLEKWLPVFRHRSTGNLHTTHDLVQLMPLPSIISRFIKIHNGSAFPVSAYPGCRRTNAVIWEYM